MTIQELTNNQKLNYWYNHIRSQQSSGLSVIHYCKINHLTPSTFYEYKKRLKQYLCDQLNADGSNQVVPFVSMQPVASASDTDEHETIIIITKGTIKIEFDHNTSYQSIEPIIRSLLSC